MEQTQTSNSALVLMALLGEDLAVSMMQYLREDEVHELSSALSDDGGRSSAGIDRLEELLNRIEWSKDYPPIA